MTTTKTSTNRATIRDPAALRALAHPVRLALLDHLGQRPDGATATECATVVGLSPSATSYHLRALAKVGMITAAPSRGDGRERVWQVSHEGYELSTDQDATTEEVAAQSALVELFLARQNDKVLRFLTTGRYAAPEWFAQSMVAERALVLTSDELKTLTERIDKLTEHLTLRNRHRPPEGARVVSFQLRVVPSDEG
ncbi:MAG TPA: helix-turn-helix domain-containing protein [Micromonosporaceae bacterium]